jgi:hypothetical protein
MFQVPILRPKPLVARWSSITVESATGIQYRSHRTTIRPPADASVNFRRLICEYPFAICSTVVRELVTSSAIEELLHHIHPAAAHSIDDNATPITVITLMKRFTTLILAHRA